MRAGIVTIMLVLLAGCGSGTGSTPPERPSGAVEGTVFNSAVSGATVRAYAFSNGVRGAQIGQALTDTAGAFTIPLSTPEVLVLLEATGGVYREEASARDVTVSPDIIMRSVADYRSGATARANITPFTAIAAAHASRQVATGRPAVDAVADAFGVMNSALGLDIRATTPIAVTTTGTGGLTPGHEYGFFCAAISQWTADASVRNATVPHTTHTSVSFSRLAVDDVSADGILDGKGAGGAVLNVGSVPLETNIYRNQIALSLLKISDSAVNKTGLTRTQLLPAANRWNASTAAIFGTAPVVPINTAGPALSNLSPPAGSALSGIFTASATAADPNDVIAAEFLVDNQLVAAAEDPRAPRASINSRAFADGSHKLKLSATNVAGFTGSIEHDVTFDNTVPTVTDFTPSDFSFVKSGFTATALVADNIGLASSTFLLDGTDIGNTGTAAEPVVVVDTRSFSFGTHTLVLRATDRAGNITDVERSIFFTRGEGG